MDPQCLRILSLDGGGIRGLSSLLILENLMEGLREANGLDKVPRPCEWFDLIGGTSTGGIIAIMLGKLGMTVDDCIRAYKKVAQQAFTPKPWAIIPGRPNGSFSATQLEAAIKQTVREYCINSACLEQRKHGETTVESCPHEGMHFRGESSTKTVVLAITKDNVDALPTLFTTYDTSASLDGCTIWQVARATSAATTFFKPIRVGRDDIEFIDAGFGYNNPCEVLIAEAQAQFPNRKKMQVLSIGTGLGDVVSISDTRKSILKALKSMATTSRKVDSRLVEQYSDEGVYFRFNVDRGLDDVTLSDWEKSSKISAHTRNYLEENRRATRRFINCLTQHIEVNHATISAEVSQEPTVTTNHWIPFPENPDFIGRTAVVRKLKEKLFDTNRRRKVALVGLGGMGKTQIALHLAYSATTLQQGWSVFWLPAFSMAGFEQECAKLVKNLGIQYSESEDVKEVLQRYLNSGRIGRWFLIIDNADDLEILNPSDGTAKGIFDFIPNHVDGRILFTTRFRRVAVAAAKNEVVKLSEMDFEEASELLQASFIKDDGFWAEEMRHEATIIRLLNILTYLPLAITQATAYMNTNQTSIKDYLKLFEHTDRKNTMELLEHGQDDETYYDKSQSAVATTWTVSFNRIRSSNPKAADILSFMSTIEPKAIPRSLLPVPETEQQLEQAIGTLLGYGFLTRRGQEAIYDIHRLVHLAALRWNEEGQYAQDVQQLALAHVAKIFPYYEWENREFYRQYLPHAQRLLDITDGIENEAACMLGYNVGTCLLAEGQRERAIHRLKHVDMVQRHIFPDNHVNQLLTQRRLANAYVENGQLEKGKRLLEYVVKIEKGILKEDDSNRPTSKRLLANAYLKNGQIREAIGLLEEIASSIQGKPAEDNGERLISQHQLGVAYLENGQIKEALELLKYVVARKKETLPEDHPEQLVSLHELGRAYLSNGQSKEAIELLEFVVARKKETLPEDHPEQLVSLHELASAYLSNRQSKEAIELLEFVVARKKETLPEDHPEQLVSLHELASAYLSNRQTNKAIELLEFVVLREKDTLPKDHPGQLTSLHNLASAYLDNRQINKAIELLEFVVARSKEILPKDHPGQLTSLHNLASAYLNNGQINKAIELLEFVVTRSKEILPKDHPGQLTSLHNLASAYLDNGQINKAIELLEGKNKAEDSDFRHENASTSIPAQEGNVTRQVDDFAPPTRLTGKDRRQGRRSQERRKRLAEMEVSTNGEPSSTQRKKTKTALLNSDLIDDLQSVIGSTGSAMNEYIIRPVGAEDTDLAVKDCTQLFKNSHGVHFVIRVIHWLRKDPINAVVWNALEGKELKEALMRSL
ncbi:Ff.00g035520.m01.CDS01 [Fusarium sp. VM40]|nr:Ff.00g035520.m01.CDS01 [Fusarium sp. VM40]